MAMGPEALRVVSGRIFRVAVLPSLAIVTNSPPALIGCTHGPSDKVETPDDSGDTESDADTDADTDSDTDTDYTLDTAPPDTGPWRQVSVGDWHACGRRSTGSVQCWGDNEYNQLAVPDESFLWVESERLSNCGILSDGAATCWGYHTDPGSMTLPGGLYSRISVDRGTACAIRSDGAIECWGVLANLQEEFPGVYRDLDVGWNNLCALDEESRIVCWGTDWELPPQEGNIKVCTGYNFGCVLNADHDLECFGAGTWYGRSEVERLVAAGPYISISCSVDTFCGVNSAGVIYTAPDYWGVSGVDDGEQYARVDCGDGGVCGLTTGGELRCWGNAWVEAVPE